MHTLRLVSFSELLVVTFVELFVLLVVLVVVAVETHWEELLLELIVQFSLVVVLIFAISMPLKCLLSSCSILLLLKMTTVCCL